MDINCYFYATKIWKRGFFSSDSDKTMSEGGHQAGVEGQEDYA